MHVHTLTRIDVGVEFVILTLVKLALVGGIQHVFAQTGLAIGRLTHNVNHAASHSTNDLLIVFQQSTIGLTVAAFAHRQILLNDKWNLFVWERILFHANHGIAYPRSNKRLNHARTINVPVTPILVNNKLLARFVAEIEVFSAIRGMMVRSSQDRVVGDIDLVQVLVLFAFFLQLRK